MTVPTLARTTEPDAPALAGRSDVVILGPSLGADVHLWDLALPTIVAHHTTLRWDLPGHGASVPAAEGFSLADLAAGVIALADTVGVDRFDYAGVSVGGAVALELARLYPDRVKSTAVVCSAAKIGETSAWAERAALVRAEGTDVLLEATPSRWFSEAFRVSHPEIVDRLLAMIEAADDDSYAMVCEALGAFDARPTLSSITVPVLVISGELDPGTPPELGAVIAESVPGARQVIIDGVSHQAVVEKPAVVGQILVDFFAEKR
ncbi:MAG: alpha/beta fold hydrolase [Actinomycetales bacterium]|nr:alpha/beta fold hydrolase [Actinomycetales bacterium]